MKAACWAGCGCRGRGSAAAAPAGSATPRLGAHSGLGPGPREFPWVPGHPAGPGPTRLSSTPGAAAQPAAQAPALLPQVAGRRLGGGGRGALWPPPCARVSAAEREGSLERIPPGLPPCLLCRPYESAWEQSVCAIVAAGGLPAALLWAQPLLLKFRTTCMGGVPLSSGGRLPGARLIHTFLDARVLFWNGLCCPPPRGSCGVYFPPRGACPAKALSYRVCL